MAKKQPRPTPTRSSEPDISTWTAQQRKEWAAHQRAMKRFEELSREDSLKLFVQTGVLNPDGTPTEHFRGNAD